MAQISEKALFFSNRAFSLRLVAQISAGIAQCQQQRASHADNP